MILRMQYQWIECSDFRAKEGLRDHRTTGPRDYETTGLYYHWVLSFGDSRGLVFKLRFTVHSDFIRSCWTV
jgi:hypothetical protein